MEKKRHHRNSGVAGLIWGMIAIMVILMNYALVGVIVGFLALLLSIFGILDKYYSKIPGILGTIACFIAIGYGFFLILAV